MRKEYSKLQFITHQNARYTYREGALLALKGGCRWVQLRMKEAPLEALTQTALQVQALCREYRATFILDDQVELARQIKADGVHLGLHDMPIDEARRLLGPNFIIGGTANTFADVQRHALAGADYIGCGPFRYTQTKQNLSPILGLEGYKQILHAMHEAKIDLPLIAIGGITATDIPALMQAGVSGIALSGAILNAPNPTEETQKINYQLK